MALFEVPEAGLKDLVEHGFSGMTEGGMAEIVTQCDRLDEVLIEEQGARGGARDLRHLERVRETRAVVVAHGCEEYLRFAFQPPERFRVQDAVTVALKRRTVVVFGFRFETAAGSRGKRCVRAERQPLTFFQLFAYGHGSHYWVEGVPPFQARERPWVLETPVQVYECRLPNANAHYGTESGSLFCGIGGAARLRAARGLDYVQVRRLRGKAAGRAFRGPGRKDGMKVDTLGVARRPSPQSAFVGDDLRIPADIEYEGGQAESGGLMFEMAGPRERLFFDPAHTRAGIVTCGGLCPGLNNVIRSLFLELHYSYGVRDVFGFRFGYQGLDPARGEEPVSLSPDFVHDIHHQGGTVLGTSRGPVDIEAAVGHLERLGVNMLFTIGGDGTQRGARELYLEARRRGYSLSVVGIPKTVDNDVAFVSRTFGYMTAVEEAAKVLACAHTEARSVRNGVSLVKLMGRHAGFIAAGAILANQDVNFALIPEVPFRMDGARGFLAALGRRIRERSHAVIVAAEGAGQELLSGGPGERDESGNVKLNDIGAFLRQQITAYFQSEGVPITLRYFDPSYLIRSVAADSEDAVMCDLFARNAVHAAMAGKTGMVVGILHDTFINVPIELLGTRTKRLDPQGLIWRAVRASCGQPERFE